MASVYQAQLWQAAKCNTCKTEDEFFARWVDRDHWIHNDHAGHHVATWLELR